MGESITSNFHLEFLKFFSYSKKSLHEAFIAYLMLEFIDCDLLVYSLHSDIAILDRNSWPS